MKKVNVAARTPVIVSSLPVPIRGTVRNIVLSEQDIFKCITQKAIVDEVLSNGSLVRLSLSNYNKVNEVVVKKEPVVVEAPAPVVVQVVETVADEEAVFDAEPSNEEEVTEEVAETVVVETTEEVVESEEAPVAEPEIENRPRNKKKHKK